MVEIRELMSRANFQPAFQSILVVGNVINIGFKLRDKKYDESFSQFIVPAFFLFFGSPLTASLVFEDVSVSSNLLMSFVAGVVIFFAIRSISSIRKILFIFPLVGRICLLDGLRTVKMPSSNVVMYLCLLEFTGLSLGSLIFKNKIVNKDLYSLGWNIAIFAAAKLLDLKRSFICATVLGLFAIEKYRAQLGHIKPNITSKRRASINLPPKPRRSSIKKSLIDDK